MRRLLVDVLRVYRINFVPDLRSTMAYPGSFWLAITTIPLWTLLQIMFIETIYGHLDTFLGYSKFENYILFGTYKIVQSIAVSLFIVQLGSLKDRVRGTDAWSLDMMLLKPIDSQVFATLGRFWFGNISSFFVGVAMVAYGLVNEPQVISLISVILYLAAICLALVFSYLIYLFLQTWLFWFEYLQVGESFWFSIQDLGQYPRQLYTGSLGLLLNVVFPVTILAAVPVDYLLGRIPIYHLLIFGLIILALAYLSRRFWQYSIRKYSSFSS